MVRVAGVLLAAALLCALTGCAAPPAPRPLVVRLSAIQSGTVHVALHQVVELTGTGDDRYTALVADDRIVSVVQRRDPTRGGLEPELVPHAVGETQVALSSSTPGGEVIGFRVIVDRPSSTG